MTLTPAGCGAFSHADLRAHAGLWFAVAAWGGSFVAARAVLSPSDGQTTLSPLVLAALRFSVAGLIFVGPIARELRRRALTRRDLVRMALLGQVTYSTYFWLQYEGVALTNAGIAAILVIGLTPLATSLIAQVRRTEVFTPSALIPLMMGLLGVVIISAQHPLNVDLRSGFLLGAGCLIANAFAFALYVNLAREWMVRITPVVLTGGTMLSGAVVLLLLSLLVPTQNTWWRLPDLNGPQWLSIFYLIACCSVAAYFVYNLALTRIRASQATVYNYAEPVIAVALGALLLKERLTLATVAGSAVIATAILLSIRR